MAANERVLIIDDRRENIAFLTDQVLNPADFEVSVAGDGETGLRKALQEKPDLIIMDLNIPRLSGLDVLRGLQQAQSNIPVILMTFHGSEEAAVQSFRLGARDYIIKPYTAEDMGRAVERALAERRLSRERAQLADNVAQANRRAERRLRELNILSGIGRSVTALLDESRLLTRIVDAAIYLTEAEEGFLLLVDEESGDLYMRAARGLGEKFARDFRLKVEDSLAGQVVRTGKPAIITGSRNEDRFKVKTGYLVKSLLHVPLKMGDTVIGVLSVDHMIEDRTFDNHDLYLLSALANYAAVAVENAHLYGRLRIQRDARATKPLPSPAAQTAVSIQPEMAEGLREFLESVQTYRQDICTRLESGSEILSGLSERVALLERWLDEVSSQGQLLPELDERVQMSADSLASLGMVQELDTILDSMVDGILVVDQDDRVAMVNQVAQVMLGGRLVGKSIEEACDDPRWFKTYRIVKAAARLGDGVPGSELTSATTPLIVAQRTLRASFRVKSTLNNGPGGIVIVLRDISAEREAQRAKDSFVESVSQELRTPITSIIGYADLLRGESVGPLSQAQQRFLERIRVNAERVGTQLNDLLGMMLVDSRQLEIRAEAMDLVSVIYEASDALRTQIAEKKQVLEMNLEPNLPYVRADPDAMYHVLRNLMQNAHRCSAEGAHIVLRSRRVSDGEERYVLVSVTDAGGGIAPQDYKKVFNRFYRSDSPAVSGLGDPEISLPVVKTLVEAHGGRVWMDSVEGEGSTFTVLLPVRHRVSEGSGPQTM